ncbi:DUF2322 family protein [Crenobacter sp. HX-7-9]|uniref:DUF2322 family protein n=1 Tax=Crenobacter caeni TaxID=2705474 RepID=A0A6B2KW32_9NEIS|nr:DUF2322 family protein [Crenobacter caeni]
MHKERAEHPGSHPNIDRLFAVAAGERRVSCRCLPCAKSRASVRAGTA